MSLLKEITSDKNQALRCLTREGYDHHVALESKQLLIFVSQLSLGEELSKLRCCSVSFQAMD